MKREARQAPHDGPGDRGMAPPADAPQPHPRQCLQIAQVPEEELQGAHQEECQAGEAQQRRHFRNDSRRLAGHRLRDGADMIGRGAAAADDHIDKTGTCEFAQQFRQHRLRSETLAC